MKRIRLSGLVSLLLFAARAAMPQAAAPPAGAAASAWKPFQEFNFLVGSWSGTAESAGKIGGRVSRWAMEIGGNYLVHRGNTIFAAQSQQPEESIEEVGYYTYDREKRKYVATYFYSTGVVAVFDVEIAPDGSVKLVSSQLMNYEAGARSRLTIAKKSDTELGLTLEIAPAGKEYLTYVTSKLTKK